VQWKLWKEKAEEDEEKHVEQGIPAAVGVPQTLPPCPAVMLGAEVEVGVWIVTGGGGETTVAVAAV